MDIRVVELLKITVLQFVLLQQQIVKKGSLNTGRRQVLSKIQKNHREDET